jgi:hypothetical protein
LLKTSRDEGNVSTNILGSNKIEPEEAIEAANRLADEKKATGYGKVIPKYIILQTDDNK